MARVEVERGENASGRSAAARLLQQVADEQFGDVNPEAYAVANAVEEFRQVVSAMVLSGIVVVIGAALYWIVGLRPLRYLVFLGMNYLICMQLFRFTTYHAFFPKAVWALIGFAVATGVLLDKLGMAGFFLWHLIACIVLFGFRAFSDSKPRAAAEQMLADDPQMLQFVRMSMATTRAYYWISVAIYLGVFAVSLVVAYNS